MLDVHLPCKNIFKGRSQRRFLPLTRFLLPLSLPAARVLEDCGTERQPRSSALWEGGHQYAWQWIPHRKVGAIFKVSTLYLMSYRLQEKKKICQCCKIVSLIC